MSTEILRHHPQPLVLLASQEAWLVQELASALMRSGFRVVTTNEEHDTVEKAQRHRPHAIVLDVGLAPPGYGLARTLRSVSLATPILLICPGQPSRANCLEALRAGAWELSGTPVDIEHFIARLGAYIEPKLELDRVSEECLVDRVSGLYNHLGLAKRADELAALATRHGLALACMVFRPAAQLPSRVASDRLALTFKSVGRASDAVGRTGRAEFAVFAPARDSWAAGRLVHRLTDRATSYGNGFDVRSGYSAAIPTHKISSHTLLARARSSLEASTEGFPQKD
jgi:PleD family two-component response regulator